MPKGTVTYVIKFIWIQVRQAVTHLFHFVHYRRHLSKARTSTALHSVCTIIYAAKLAQNGGSVKKFVKDLHTFLEGGEQ